jgi:uncharacterized protein YeaO (DUF488 family)
VKRIYDPPARSDGFRLLVDRLWPRGVSKARARLDAWWKDLAPSAELRQWFHQRSGRWQEFRRRYRAELALQSAETEALRRLLRRRRVTLLYGARDAEHNHALVLKEWVEQSRG